MKTNNFKIIAVIVGFFSFYVTGSCSESDSEVELHDFGFGIHMEQFKLNDIMGNANTIPANKLIFTINVENVLRIEPELGFNYVKNKEDETEDLGLFFGLGVFGMNQKGRTNIYGGLRFEYGNIKYQYSNWIGGGTVTDKTDRISVGPVCGAEYMFGTHFSIGGEFGVYYIGYKTKDGLTKLTAKEFYITLSSGLLMRFYF